MQTQQEDADLNSEDADPAVQGREDADLKRYWQIQSWGTQIWRTSSRSSLGGRRSEEILADLAWEGADLERYHQIQPWRIQI